MKNVATFILGVALCCCVGCPGIVLPGGSDSAEDVQLVALLTAQNVEAIAKPTVDAAKVTLGQALFFDKILSGNRNISCSTCHTPLAFTGDGLSMSIGQSGSDYLHPDPPLWMAVITRSLFLATHPKCLTVRTLPPCSGMPV